MATKKLSRTVIEGGRHGYNKFERRHSHIEARAEERDYLKAVLADLDLADELDIGIRRPVRKEFTDKLSPMYRWLDAQVGRPWDIVRSEIFSTFDTRTTAGRHITFDHLLREIVDTDSGFDKHGNIADPNVPAEPSNRKARGYRRWSFADYYVDRQGILQARPDKDRHAWNYYEKVSEEEFQLAAAWLNGRMVMEHNGKLHWVCPTQDVWMASWYEPHTSSNYPSLAYYVWRNGEYKITSSHQVFDWRMGYSTTIYTDYKEHGDHWEKVKEPYSFRQRGELSQEEVKQFHSFKKRIRDDILSFVKGR